ncbi:MAG: lysophospholipid acyltransferase family protein [Shimia sp.]
MSQVWTSPTEGAPLRITPLRLMRAVVRGVPLAFVTFGCLLLLLFVRLAERPLYRAQRPWTPHITRFVCRCAFPLLGMGHSVEGEPLEGAGALVANHSSWLDIFALNAPTTLYFVSKAEVAGWPGIGWLARATGTVFIKRRRTEAATHRRMFEERLSLGHRLLFFPEGTSTDGKRVLPFKPTLFAAFFTDELREGMKIQPVSVIYTPPEGQDDRFYGWWGEMDFGTHLLKCLMVERPGSVKIIYHPPVRIVEFENRKELAMTLQRIVALPVPYAEAR